MTSQIRAELAKIARRPAAWLLLAAAATLSQVFGYLVPYLSYATGSESNRTGVPSARALAGTLPDQLVLSTIGGFPVFAGALALVLGALLLGSEYGWGTVKTLLTQRPGRGAVLAAQLAALWLAVAVGVVVLYALSAASSAAIAAAEDAPADWPAPVDLAAGMGAGWLILGMWATLGTALAIAFRGVALPIGLGVVWVLGVENLVTAMAQTVLTGLQPVRDLLPGVNAGSLVAAVSPDRLLDPPPGVSTAVGQTHALLTLAAYVAASLVVSAWVWRRRDVV
jgi:ABC-2 type transport system permease protein